MRYPKANNYVLFDEVGHYSAGGFTKWYGLHPLGKIFCGHKEPYVPIGRQIDWSHKAKPLSVEKP